MRHLFFVFLLFFVFVPALNAQQMPEPEEEIIIELPSDLGNFNSLKEIGVTAKIPLKYERYLKCHGREGECADMFPPVIERPELKEMYVQQIKDKYESFPKALLPQSLAESTAEKMREEFWPFMNPEETNIFVIETQEQMRRLLTSPNSMIVYVELRENMDQSSQIGLLTLEFFRSETEYKTPDFEIFTDHAAAFLWPENDEQAKSDVQAFLDGFVFDPSRSRSCSM